LIDLQHSFTAAKSSKSPTKRLLSYHHTLSMLLHYLGKLKNQKFALLMQVKHVSNCDFLSSIQQIKEMPNVVKISEKINTMQNINILLFVRSLSLTRLKLCSYLSMVVLSTTKHQHNKKADAMDRSHLNQKHMKMQIVCKSLFTKMFKMSTNCTDTCLETLSSLVNCSINNDLSEIGPYRN